MPKIYEHPATSPILQRALKSTLPYSISLVYRTQHSNQTQHAHILASFPPSTDETEIPEHWVAAYYDYSKRPETELWIFSSGQVPDEAHQYPQDGFCSTCEDMVLALIAHMKHLPRPPLHPDNTPALNIARQHVADNPSYDVNSQPMTTGSFLRHLLSPSVITLGACHKAVVQILRDAGLVRDDFPGAEAELNKFIFKVSDLPQTKPIPEGLRWGPMREQDVEIVQSRTSIPRSMRTLMSLKSLGVFNEAGTPIAWVFLGLDGSLTTLHVEPEYRGRGIAKSVSSKLIRDYAPALAVDNKGVAWSHADVYLGNVQSESVCKSLGAQAMWRIFWVRIDVDKA